MIAIVSSSERERGALASLCESRGWPFAECGSFRALKTLLHRTRPKVILTRHQLLDGYSDDILALVSPGGQSDATKVIVLIGAGTSAGLDVRQVSLGADFVQRDPVRMELICAYLAKFRTAQANGWASPHSLQPTQVAFAGGTVDLVERTLRHSHKSAQLTPREIELVRILFESRGTVVTYDTLYSEILDRRFRGDTSNMRVLLGKLGASFRSVGVPLRKYIGVIPKTGYRYAAPAE